jgi:hypothetical protein
MNFGRADTVEELTYRRRLAEELVELGLVLNRKRLWF